MANAEAPNILIVDDSAMTRAMIKRVISMTEIEVHKILEAENGKAGLAVMESERVNLVLADLNMPVMDGVEMIGKMRGSESLRHIHVVVITAQPDPDQLEMLRRDGVAAFLAKPFTPERILSVIGPMLVNQRLVENPEVKAPDSFNLTLAEALVEALETMAFISPELPEQSDLPPAAPDVRVVHVAFHGDGIDGTLAIAAPPEFGAVVASNCEASEASKDSDDALKELANVTCGLLLRKRLGGGAGFKMEPPVMGTANELKEWMAEGDFLAVSADGHLVTAHVSTDASLLPAGGTHS